MPHSGNKKAEVCNDTSISPQRLRFVKKPQEEPGPSSRATNMDFSTITEIPEIVMSQFPNAEQPSDEPLLQ